MAAYETFIGDMDHAEDIYSYLAAAPESPNLNGGGNLYRYNELGWGTLGAVNFAHLRSLNGDTLAAQKLLNKAREFIASDSTHVEVWFDGSVSYVLAQIAAIEGNNETAMEYFREAVDAGWIRPWFGRIDPIMEDLREEPEFMQILVELEERLLEMRQNTSALAAN